MHAFEIVAELRYLPSLLFDHICLVALEGVNASNLFIIFTRVLTAIENRRRRWTNRLLDPAQDNDNNANKAKSKFCFKKEFTVSACDVGFDLGRWANPRRAQSRRNRRTRRQWPFHKEDPTRPNINNGNINILVKEAKRMKSEGTSGAR